MTNTFGSSIYFDKANQCLKFSWHSLKIWSDLIFLVALLITYFAYEAYQHQTRMKLANFPQKNDFYFVDYHSIEPNSDAKFRYLPLKILAVEKDEVRFKVGNIGHEKAV